MAPAGAAWRAKDQGAHRQEALDQSQEHRAQPGVMACLPQDGI